jgi:hypothetical protein
VSTSRPTVCLLAQTLGYPEGGGHFWCYYNWALGFQSAGFRVIWLETVGDKLATPDALHRSVVGLRRRLATEAVSFHLALTRENSAPLPGLSELGALSLTEAAAQADLLVNFRYGFPHEAVRSFRRSVLMDIDPGLLAYWISKKYFTLAPHDAYATVGGNIGTHNPLIPATGRRWERIRPAVHLPSWPVQPVAGDASFSAISHWHANEYVEGPDGEYYANTKRAAFEPYLELPQKTTASLELCLCLSPEDEPEANVWRASGWRVTDSHVVTSTPVDYRRYIQQTAGEFGVAKPAYVKMNTGWISDRTVCYLASGRPCVVQDTGPIDVPAGEGLVRFGNLAQAAEALDRAWRESPSHRAAARRLAEEYFSAEILAQRVAALVL